MDNPRITEEEIGIIKRAQAGDELAFNRIFKRYKGFVTHILYQYLKDYDEAKDVTNVVFLKVHDKLSKFVEYDSFGGWLRVLTNRTAIDYLRHTKHIRTAKSLDSEDYRLWFEDQYTPADDLVNRQTYTEVLSFFDTLPKSHKNVMELFYVQNLTVAQISDALRMPKGTIKAILSRTRSKIKKQIKLKAA
jgi:RNA polymerase sigma-70 factor (ECF subfamily)